MIAALVLSKHPVYIARSEFIHVFVVALVAQERLFCSAFATYQLFVDKLEAKGER